MKRIGFLLPLFLLFAPHGLSSAQEEMAVLGAVDFSVSCDEAAQTQFNRGLALLHHMMYEQARAEFEATAETDPQCAMAHWGVAMTLFQPLWAGGEPGPEALQQGRELIEQALSLDSVTEREQAYLGALEAFYADQEMAYPERLQAFERGMEEVYTAYPDDLDSGAFYALAHLATAPRADKTVAHQRRAAEVLGAAHAEESTHPGAIHYGIHAHDVPPLASEGAALARSYDQIAPEVPHALHMPSHIFTRLGEWSDAASWNLRSAQAALDVEPNMTSAHYFHAMDYAAYALLQQGQDEGALNVLQEVQAQETYPHDFAIGYALAAIPARYALERRQWADAAALTPRAPGATDWDALPQTEAITHFAKGIGAARSGDTEVAREAIDKLDALHESLRETNAYWATQTEIQRLAVAAWLARAEADDTAALELMQASAELEASTDKHPVTPGSVLPAQELLGDLLMELDRPAAALAAYQATLEVAPGRFNSLLGAGNAAERAGDTEQASEYYTQLTEMASGSERTGLEEVRAFLARN